MRRIRVSPDEVMSLKGNMCRSMRTAIELLYKEKEWHAMVALIMSYVEAMEGGGKPNFKKALRRDFPELCKEFPARDPADEFYQAFRNGFLHLFIPKGRYALVRETHTEGDYFCEIEAGKRGVLIGLNVDRFAREFLELVKRREHAAGDHGGA